MIQSNKSPIVNLYSYSLVLPLLMVTCFIMNPFCVRLLQAQETQKTAGSKPSIQLSAEQWKALEGIFQNSGNMEMYVQFTAKDNELIAKLLWNNNEIRLTPESTLTFFSKDAGEGNPLRISFKKDSSGALTQVSVNNEDLWNRVKDYKPVIKKEIDHTPGQLKSFEGLYQLQNDAERFIQFMVKGNELVLKQHWDGNEIPFVPQSELDFFSKVAPLFSLTFTKENDGTISQVLAFKRDRWFKVKKVQPSVEQLKAMEGKYQFKDDKDNYIQITVRGNNLVVKQLWDGKEIMLEPQTETYFYNSNESYPLQIIKDTSGRVIQVLALGIDLFDKLKE